MGKLETVRTREHELALAKERSDKAKTFKKMLIELRDNILKEFPPGTFNLTKKQIEKAKSFEAIMDRLSRIQMEESYLKDRFDREDERIKKIEEEKKLKEIEIKRIESNLKYKQDALVWLQYNYPEYRLGKDYSLDCVEEFAEECAKSEEISRIMEKSAFIGFSGDDYCEDCLGWDGSSRRCQCGNRRVYWVTGDCHRFDKPYVYAEAY